MAKLTTDFQIEMQDVTPLINDALDRVHQFSFTPDYFWVVSLITAGNVIIYPSGSPGDRLFVRLKTGYTKIPANSDKIASRCIGANGTFTVYAVKGTGEFKAVNFTA